MDILLGDLCTQWGFCNRLLSRDLLSAKEVVTDEIFARAVLVAEGWNPEYELTWLRAIADKFVERYGQSVSRASHAEVAMSLGLIPQRDS